MKPFRPPTKKKKYFKIGYSGYDSEIFFFIGYRPFNSGLTRTPECKFFGRFLLTQAESEEGYKNSFLPF